MDRYISGLLQIIRRKEFPIYVVFLIAALSTMGWMSGKMGLASYSLAYIPIAPANVLILIVLTTTFLVKLKIAKSWLLESITTLIVLLVALFCLFILLNYRYGFSWDLEKLMVKNPDRFGNVVSGRISPISSLLYIFICIGILSINEKSSLKVRYIGGSFSSVVFLISSVLLIGYLYGAPLLYGSNIIPVSLPSAICIFLFSSTLLRIYGSRFWTFNLVKDNKVRNLLLKSFLPVAVFIIILQGFLDANWSFNDENPPLTEAFVLLIVIVVTTIIVYRVSTIIGAQLLTAEKQVKESEEKFRSIMEHSSDAIFITNQNGQYLYNNKAASDMLGYSSEELKNKTIADLSPSDKVAEYLKVFKQILSNEKVLIEIELLKNDGKFITTELSAVLLPDGTVYGSCRDITERKNAENKVKVLNRELSALNIDKDRFIAILGHDLKSPFNNLLGLSGVLIDDLPKLSNEEIDYLANSINLTAKKTYSLLEDILMWARTQQGKMPFNPQMLNLGDICNQILDIHRTTAEKKRITIDYVGPEDMIVFADQDMLKTILRNLFTNAIKFTNANGTIKISATKNGEKVLITVSDDGIGIDPENISKLFDITQVLSTQGTDGESGTGLGLLLCKDFVEKHGAECGLKVKQEKEANSSLRFDPVEIFESMDIHIRKATESDFPDILKLIKELALFEKSPGKVTNTVELMNKEKALFNCFVAETEEKEIVGMAIYFFAYYTWVGKSLYLEDLYVKESFRKQKIGSTLLKKVFEIANVEDCKRVRWQVLSWNKSAIQMYSKSGAVIDNEWLNCSFDSEGIRNFRI